MTAQQNRRKLAAILHADVAGSTALVQRDENFAHSAITAAFGEFSKIVTRYGGVVHEVRGDALVAEFARPSDAVSAAISFQQAQPDDQSQDEDDCAVRVRIGIALGEAIFADRTVTGSGVILAQRIENLAEPGGVCIQGSVYEAIPRGLPFTYLSLGDRSLKGFDETVRVYAVGLETGSNPPPPEAAVGRSRTWSVLGIAAAVLLAIAFAWYMPWLNQGGDEPAVLAEPDKPSVVVLPFTNMSADPDQDYFANGITEDLITDLSKLSNLFVIARNSSFSYKGRGVPIEEVARELGVRYVVEGSVRRAGKQVRINAQLVDAASQGHLWADRYDGSLEDIFTLQDEVLDQIVTALKLQLDPDESRRSHARETDSSAAHDAFLQGWALFKLGTLDARRRSLPLFEQAIDLDPDYSRAHAALASVYWDAYRNDWALELDLPSFEAEARSLRHLENAMRDPIPLAHDLQAKMLLAEFLYAEAIAEAEKAVELDNNDATAQAALAKTLVLNGDNERSILSIETAIRLDPHHPPEYLTILGAAQFGLGRLEAARATFIKAIEHGPEEELPRLYLAATHAQLGDIDSGQAVIEDLNRLRHRRGLSAVSLEKNDFSGWSPFRGEIDFAAFGKPEIQDKVRAGLSRIPELQWHYLVTARIVLDAGNTTFDVEGATRVDAAGARELFDRGVQFVDNSHVATWRQRRIPGAVNLPRRYNDQDYSIPVYSKSTLAQVVRPDQEFLLYWCEEHVQLECNASYEAAKAVAWGYQKVYWLSNRGFHEWLEAGHPIDRTAK